MTTMQAVPVNRDEIKRLREEADLSQTEAARRAGMKNYQQWQHIENGTRADPSVSSLQRVAFVLGVTLDDLVLPIEGED
ncbi:MAG: helix-turn-helix transcriptional regulator [Planctomycetota bacterium]